MNIVTSYDRPPIPTTMADWSAIDQDTYDEGQPIGRGPTERAAINDLVEQLLEQAAAPECAFAVQQRGTPPVLNSENDGHSLREREGSMGGGGPTKLYRHIKSGGIYELLLEGLLERNREPVVIYRAIDRRVWVRSRDEFFDGRFEAVTGSVSAVQQQEKS